MRVVKEIPSSFCKITIYHWNNRYLIKLEQGPLEQTFKIDQFNIGSEEDLYKLIDENFLQQASSHFVAMEKSLLEALQRV